MVAMVSVLTSGLSGTGSSPGQGYCVVFLGTAHGTSFHQVYKWLKKLGRCLARFP